MGVSDHTGGSGSVYRRAADSGFTEIEAAGRAAGQNIWLIRMRSDNSGFHVGKGNVRSVQGTDKAEIVMYLST